MVDTCPLHEDSGVAYLGDGIAQSYQRNNKGREGQYIALIHIM
jgi:hypothetical protein